MSSFRPCDERRKLTAPGGELVAELSCTIQSRHQIHHDPSGLWWMPCTLPHSHDDAADGISMPLYGGEHHAVEEEQS